MDEFLCDINYQIFIHYLDAHLPYPTKKERYDGCYMIKGRDENIQFFIYCWDNKIIEFKKMDDKVIQYYLHFEFTNFLNANTLFYDFIDYYHYTHLKRIYHILICCTGGMTSTYFAENIKKIMTTHNIEIDASSYTCISKVKDRYDMILLAPQIYHIKKDIQTYKNTHLIPTNLYATYNFEKIYDFIINLLLQKEV